jgi:hypothetical protein
MVSPLLSPFTETSLSCPVAPHVTPTRARPLTATNLLDPTDMSSPRSLPPRAHLGPYLHPLANHPPPCCRCPPPYWSLSTLPSLPALHPVGDEARSPGLGPIDTIEESFPPTRTLLTTPPPPMENSFVCLLFPPYVK